MKVFGIGLNKTGTTTLAHCLRHLGFRHAEYRRDLIGRYWRREFAPIFAYTDAFDSFEDWPYPLMYDLLFGRYSTDAKFILTRRKSPDAWLESIKRHSLRANPARHAQVVAYGLPYAFGAEDHYVSIYEKHLAAVRQYFFDNGAAHQLCELCWEEGDAWDKLCKFLGRPVPDTAFPHANEGNGPIPVNTLMEHRSAIRRQFALLHLDMDDEAIEAATERAIRKFV